MTKQNDYKVKGHEFESRELQVNTLIIKGIKCLPYILKMGIMTLEMESSSKTLQKDEK